MPTMTHREYADSLRLIADWFEAHPEIRIPNDADEFNVYNVHTQEELARAVRALGGCKKEYSDSSGLFRLKRKFGGIELRFVTSRDKACKRKVTGTVRVPEQVIPAHEVSIVEWECLEAPPLLASAPAPAPAPSPEPIPIDAPLAQAIRYDQQQERRDATADAADN